MTIKVPDKPFSASFDEWDQWRSAAKKRYPIRFFLSETLPSGLARFWNCYVHEPWYWLKCRVWHRYNVLVMRDLLVTWSDRDTRMLHACFQLLKDFVEQEEIVRGEWSHVNANRETLIERYNHTYPGIAAEIAADIRNEAEERADGWMEVRALYDWWEVRRKDELFDDDDKDDEMLHRLIKVRGYLWT